MRTTFKTIGIVAFVSGLSLLPGAVRAQGWQWAAAPGPGSTASSSIGGTADDGAGNTIVAGFFSGTLTLGSFTLTSAGSQDLFVGRLNSSGQWIQAIRAGGSAAEGISKLVVDASGNVIVAGTFSGPTLTLGTTTLANEGSDNTRDVFVARLSPAGVWTQAVQAGGFDNDNVGGLAVDATGAVTIAGSYGLSNAPIRFGSVTLASSGALDIYVARLSSAGSWTQASRAGGSQDEEVRGLAVDANGTATVVGYFRGSTTQFGSLSLTNADPGGFIPDIFVAQLSSTGTWLRAVQGGGAGGESPQALVVDANGTITIAGSFQAPTTRFGSTVLTSAGQGDLFVAQLSPAGVWTQAVQAGGADADEALALALDASGTPIVVGRFLSATAAFGPTTLTNSNAGTADLFVAHLTRAGSWEQVVRGGGNGHENGFSAALGANGNLIVAGDYSGAAVFGSTTLPAPVSFAGAFVARLARLPLGVRQVASLTPLVVYPNPAAAGAPATLRLPAAPAATQPVVLRDALGRVARQLVIPAGRQEVQVPTAGLTPGLYLLEAGLSRTQLVVE